MEHTRYTAIGVNVNEWGFLDVFKAERVDFVGDVEFFEDDDDLVVY